MRDLPEKWQPYLELIRIEKPTGTFLLLLPCFWAILLIKQPLFPTLKALFIFALGALAMRSAGCAWNDWADKNLDPHVPRTQNRPMARGAVAPWEALGVIGVCSLLAFGVWLLLTPMAKILSLLALALAIIYPFSKRFLPYPQAVLGLAFNSGVWIVWAHMDPTFRNFWTVFFLYITGFFWTLAYDTIYAAPDREGDESMNMGSLALYLGYSLKSGVSLFYLAMLITFILAGLVAKAHTFFYFILVFCTLAMLFLVQRLDTDDTQACQQFFQRNATMGWIIFLGLIISR